MAKLTWHDQGERLYETGVSNGVLFLKNEDGAYPLGVAWNGLSNVTEKPTGAEPSAIYADNGKYLNLMSAEEFGASIEAYMYPDDFAICDGTAEIVPGLFVSQQRRHEFGFSYKTLIGNDTEYQEYGYKIHLVYNAMAAPTEKAYSTINDTPEAITFSWDVTTTPMDIPGHKPSAHLIVNSTHTIAAKLEALEAIIYGTESVDARLPLPAEVITLLTPDPPQG